MLSVKVNGTANSLVHKGSSHISQATMPDVCKTPSPGGPVPIPYPNISQSATLAKGTTSVKADGGMMIAIKGSEFSLSNGDNAGTAGGVKSSTFMKESTWISYSFDVKMNGKGACRLSDKKFQNHENTVDMLGARSKRVKPKKKKAKLKCGEVGTYSQLNAKAAAPKFERDHIPSQGALLARARKVAKRAGLKLSAARQDCVDGLVTARGMCIAVPLQSHNDISPTCKSKNTPAKIKGDAKTKKSMKSAVNRDLREMQKHLDDTDPECAARYRESARKVRKHDNDKTIKQAIKDCP